MTATPAQPALLDTLTELPRAGLEAARLALSLPRLNQRIPRGDGHPVLVLPAYGLGDLGLWPLRRFLSGLGYQAFAWELGVNFDQGEMRIRRVEDAARFRRVQSERVAQRAREIQAQTGRRPSLVGWSMGGLFAFDAARRAPELVRHVVTLGSPFGDPRGTSLWHVMRRLNGSRVPVEEQDFSSWLSPVPHCEASPVVPVTIVFSGRDGIVSERTARIDSSMVHESGSGEQRGVRYERIESSHLGFPVNREAYRVIARALASNGAE